MDTLEELKYYCDEPQPVGALMLTGEWGCGKTNLLPVVLVNFNILKNISKFLQNVVVLDLIEHCKPVICFQIYSLAL
ncbi:P-loop NTPase fold protein [Enterococcus faecium]|uniref:P-loop NTPase fold protein n=1 Tax=Enterococcus faecium TaxID=1352 RepID=UPI0011B04956